jgi:hypothetical protein
LAGFDGFSESSKEKSNIIIYIAPSVESCGFAANVIVRYFNFIFAAASENTKYHLYICHIIDIIIIMAQNNLLAIVTKSHADDNTKIHLLYGYYHLGLSKKV